MGDKEVTRAGFGPRAAAYLIDRALLLAALTCLRLPFGIASLLGADRLTRGSFLFRYSVVDVLCWLAAAAYFVLLTYFSGSTLGKKIMKLSVRREDGGPLRFIDVLYRETVGRFLSGILYIGYIMALVDKRHRAFHDWLCETCVVYESVSFAPKQRKTPALPSGEGEAPDGPAPAVLYSIPSESAVPAEPMGEEE